MSNASRSQVALSAQTGDDEDTRRLGSADEGVKNEGDGQGGEAAPSNEKGQPEGTGAKSAACTDARLTRPRGSQAGSW